MQHFHQTRIAEFGMVEPVSPSGVRLDAIVAGSTAGL
jgi:hypothetical protein